MAHAGGGRCLRTGTRDRGARRARRLPGASRRHRRRDLTDRRPRCGVCGSRSSRDEIAFRLFPTPVGSGDDTPARMIEAPSGLVLHKGACRASSRGPRRRRRRRRGRPRHRTSGPTRSRLSTHSARGSGHRPPRQSPSPRRSMVVRPRPLHTILPRTVPATPGNRVRGAHERHGRRRLPTDRQHGGTTPSGSTPRTHIDHVVPSPGMAYLHGLEPGSEQFAGDSFHRLITVSGSAIVQRRLPGEWR